MNEAPQTALSALRLMPSKSSEVASFSYQIIKAVQHGEANPLEVLVMLRSLEAVSEAIREEIEENILTEAEKHAEKKFEAYGATVERCEVGTKYHYLKTNDIEYEAMHAEHQTLTRRLKEREEWLKALTGPLQLLNTDTGETYQVVPPQKTSKSSVKVYLKNK